MLKFRRTAWLHVKTQGLYQIDDMILRESDLMPSGKLLGIVGSPGTFR